jgi:hypothetical protein
MKPLLKFLPVFLLFGLLLFLPGSARAQGLEDGPIFGDNFTLQSGETYPNDLVVFGGSVVIETDARVSGSVILFGGSLSMNGEVAGDVVVVGGAASLGETARVKGSLVTVGATVSRAPGAKVDGGFIAEPTRPQIPAPVQPATPVEPEDSPSALETLLNPVWKFARVLLGSAVFGVFASLLVLFLPVQTRRVGETLAAQPVTAGGVGLLSILAFVVAMVALGLFSILIITLLLTIPLFLALGVLFSAASALGWVGLGTEIGLRVGSAFGREAPLPLAAGLGTFVLNLLANSVGLIPIIGWILPAGLSLLTLGAVMMTRFGTRSLTAQVTSPPGEG